MAKKTIIGKITAQLYKNVRPIMQTTGKQPSKPQTAKPHTPPTTQPKSYLDHINNLIKANEKHPYTYISNLRYSEKTYDAFRQAMEIKTATPTDLFVHSLTFRAEAINNGFLTLTRAGNYLCAMALIRMQIDNFLMAWAGLLSRDRDKFFLHYNTGRPINQLTDAQGNKLTQGHIIQTYSQSDPLIKEIYSNGNNYIHPSHIFQEEAISLTSGIQLLSYREHECSEETKQEARRHMLIANNLLCNALCHWVLLKHGIDISITES